MEKNEKENKEEKKVENTNNNNKKIYYPNINYSNSYFNCSSMLFVYEFNQ